MKYIENTCFRLNLSPFYIAHHNDREYAGWVIKKENIPESPFDGAKGKKVFCLLPGMHPYLNAYSRSMSELADQNGIFLTVLYADWNPELQARQVDYSIESNPDVVILSPLNSAESIKWYQRINAAGIPVIASNFLPEDEGFKYVLAWTGPDDWGQFNGFWPVYISRKVQNNIQAKT